MASENFTCYPCSAVLTVTSGSGKIVTAVHHSNDSEHGTLGYHGFNSGDKDLLIPSAKKNVGGWDASITVQNVGSLPTDIHIYYYDQAGNTYGDPHGIYGLYPGQSIEVYDLPYGLNGSAWINSTDSEVVAVVHQAYRNGSDTRHYGYSVP
jgi:hypothetical protein